MPTWASKIFSGNENVKRQTDDWTDGRHYHDMAGDEKVYCALCYFFNYKDIKPDLN